MYVYLQDEGGWNNIRMSMETAVALAHAMGRIPMQNGSVPVLHAGAAMHCWPELDVAISEIYRVLQPNGGRYFATTFLNRYFATLQQMDNNVGGGGGGDRRRRRIDNPTMMSGPSQQAFQYFESVDTLRSLLERGGFAPDKIQIEVLGTSCVVIRAEK